MLRHLNTKVVGGLGAIPWLSSTSIFWVCMASVIKPAQPKNEYPDSENSYFEKRLLVSVVLVKLESGKIFLNCWEP